MSTIHVKATRTYNGLLQFNFYWPHRPFCGGISHKIHRNTSGVSIIQSFCKFCGITIEGRQNRYLTEHVVPKNK
jgi:hypothetical protein